jgi:hypothetical protein
MIGRKRDRIEPKKQKVRRSLNVSDAAGGGLVS